MDFPLDYARASFPSYKEEDAVHFDNASRPAPLAAVSALADGALDGDSSELLQETRESLAFFLNSNVEWAEEEIVIAPSADELNRRLSRALAAGFPPDAEIITTDLADDESVSSWEALGERGIATRRWRAKRPSASIDTNRIGEVLSDRTRVVVMSKASSIVGSLVELLPVALAVRDREASLIVNWSAFLPHGAVDVRFLRADFVIASTKTFFGADVGFLWGNRERMRELRERAPETFDGLEVDVREILGFRAALRYVEELGLVAQEMQLQPSEDYGRRRHMRRGMQAIRHYERELSHLALVRLQTIPGATVFGVSDPDAAAHRIPHVLFRVDGIEPRDLAAALAEKDVFIDHGNGDSPRLMETLGLPESEGGCQLSLLHYNRRDEIERFADALHEIAPRRATVSG